MAASHLATADAYAAPPIDKAVSAVSWGAILAGAAAAAALSLILLVLGAGLGLTSISPYARSGAGAVALGISAIVWVMVTQALASGMGGYLAGRLRSRWLSVHSDEVFFRDTAHGFLTWAVASLVTAAVLSSAVGAIVGGAVKTGATVAGAAASSAVAAAATGDDAEGGGPTAYFIDTMFRRPPAPAAGMPVAPAEPIPAAEVKRILLQAGTDKPLAPEDQRYLAQLVAERTGLAPADAEKRVSDTVASMQAKARALEAEARDAAEKARKAGITATLWLFVSLLLGAFSASLAATWGGRERDA